MDGRLGQTETGRRRWRGAACARACAGVLMPLLGAVLASGAVTAQARSGDPPALAFQQVAAWRDQPRRLYEPLPWPEGHAPGGLALAPAAAAEAAGVPAGWARLYATDPEADAVHAYDVPPAFVGSPGESVAVLVASIGDSGGVPGSFRAPRDLVALDDGTLAVADTGNDRVQRVTASGEPITEWPVAEPWGMARTAAGEIAVVSRAAHSLAVYRPDGRLLREYALGDRLRSPEGLAWLGGDAEGGLFAVADPVAGLLRGVRDGSGRQSSLMSGRRGIRGGAMLVAGESRHLLAGVTGAGLLIANDTGAELDRLTFDDVSDVAIGADGAAFAAVAPDGPVRIADLRAVLDRETDTFGRFLSPRRIAAGASALVADRAPRVHSWSLAGEPRRDVPFDTALADDTGRPSAGPGPLPEEDHIPAADVAVGGTTDGAPSFVLWHGGRLRRLDGGRFSRTWEPAEPEAWPIAIAATADRVAVYDLGTVTVRILDHDLQPIGGWRVSDAFGGIADIALDRRSVWLVDRHRWALEGWTSAGERIADIRLPGRPERVAAGPGPSASDAGGASGGQRIYVLTGVGWIHAFDERGRPAGAWPAAGAAQRATDLAVGADGRIYVADETGGIRVFAADRTAPPALPAPAAPGACAAGAFKSASPVEVELGEIVDVQLIVDGVCPGDDEVVDVVLTLDRSGSMAGAKLLAAKDAAVRFVGRIDAPRSRLGLVSFNSSATLDSSLTESRQDVIGAIASMRAGGSTNLVDALAEALRTAEVSAARPVIVFLSDGRHQHGSVPLGAIDDVIARTREAGVRVFAIGLGEDADAHTLRRMASEPDDYFFSPSEAELDAIYAQIAGRISTSVLFEDVDVVDVVPDNMEYLRGSGSPAEPAWNPVHRTLTWSLGRVAEPGFRLSYSLRPLEAGIWPTNVEARTRHVDGRGAAGSLTFPVPWVRVPAEPVTPTASPPASKTPSPTATPRPSATPSPSPPPPSPPASPTTTPTAEIHRAYLPIAAAEVCPPGTGVDVVLVVDSSTSMRAGTRPDGPSKLIAAIEAAQNFVSLLAEPADRVGVVQFNDSAQVLAELSPDRNRALSALAEVSVSPGTRIDAGIEAAAEVLEAGGAETDHDRVVVLLTDGRPTVSSASRVILAAEELKATGAVLFTIGLGSDADPDLLRLAASRPSYYFHAPDTADLERVYDQIAARLPPCGRKAADG